MKKKIFLIIASLGAGGSERVYWLLSQYFDKDKYAVSVILLDSRANSFSSNIPGIQFIDLETTRASRSFFKLYKLLRTEKPFAVFSTNDHINNLTAIVACFLKIPKLIARASNNPHEMKKYHDIKGRFYNLFTRFLSLRYDFIVCQTAEMQSSMSRSYGVRLEKLKIIPNPVLSQAQVKNGGHKTGLIRLIAVARLSEEKGLFRLLNVMQELPENYCLTIAGDGPLMSSLKTEVSTRLLEKRVTFSGKIINVPEFILQHDLLVLSSYTEGFPNVILEALTVGVPVVSLRVGGVQDAIREGFNGFIAEQNDLADFRNKIIRACSQNWQHKKIQADVNCRFSLEKIGRSYEELIMESIK